MARVASGSFVSLPNLVSLSRLPMAAVFPFLHDLTARVVLVAVAAATDVLDGYLARSRKETSRLGALIDPVADRCFVMIAVGTLWLESTLTLLATVVVLSRDLAVIGAMIVTRCSLRLRRIPFVARPAGKVVTVLQFVILTTAYIAPGLIAAGIPLVAIASVVAIVDYARVLMRGYAA